ncbi:MAG: alcohol dehydrogenase catalytic domain-containing protein, partial [Lachnospiraceae bacterium]|nr:alcohol dehydrogenase catalytic domain-containing protein [Lachnospiraceae bacterium]
MKALQFYGKNDYALKEVPVPEIDENGILLKVKAAAVCGSDLRMIQNGYKDVSRENPRIYGHEIAGIIEKTGKNVKNYRPGMTVAIAPNMGCGVCDACVSGNTHLCRDYQAFGINRDGGFAEYVAIPKEAVVQGNIVPVAIGEHMTFEKAAVLEPLSCVYNGFEQVGIKPCDSVL